MTHVPFKPWCPICVKSQAQNPPHKRLHHELGFPSFHMDYMFMNPNVNDDQSNYPILIIRERKFRGIWAAPAVRKGIHGGDKMVERVVKIITDFGAPKVIIKSDQEPAMKDTQREIRKEMNIESNELKDAAADCATYDIFVPHIFLFSNSVNFARSVPLKSISPLIILQPG